jgi:SPP1 gp7 family putative phage head morphogenesis protein
MESVNERIRDILIAHGLMVIRYGTATAREITQLLNSVDADLRDVIAKRLAAIEERGIDVGPSTTKRLNDLIAEIGDVNAGVYAKVGDKLFADLGDFAVSEADFQVATLNTSLSIDINAKSPSPTLLRAITDEKPMEGRLLSDWVQGMETGRLSRIEQAIRSGMVQGKSTDQIVRSIAGTKAAQYGDGVLDISRRSAEAITRTAINHVSNAAAQMTWAESSDFIKGWSFCATLDSRTTVTCAGLNNRQYPIGQGPIPPLHIRCRSISIPTTKSFRELGLDRGELAPGDIASMDGVAAGDTTFTDFLNRKGTATQDEILGPTRAKLFRAGKLDLGQFIRRDGTVLTLAELKKLHPTAFE